MIRKVPVLLALGICVRFGFGQTVKFKNHEYEMHNVKASVVMLGGEHVLKVERDLKAFPLDEKHLIETVDAPTYSKLMNVDFEYGSIEVKVRSQLEDPLPLKGALGFIGLAYRVNPTDSAYESIYLRPGAGRSESQAMRNHTVQYYAYPDYKFDKLAKETGAAYETYADIGLDEWITMRIDVSGGTARLYLNDQKNPSFIVEKMKGSSTHGTIGLWVDIGTVGYFKDLKIIKR